MADHGSSASSLLESIANHLALPPQLPAISDSAIDQIEDGLTRYLLDASHTLRDFASDDTRNKWDCTCNVLRTSKIVNTGSKLNKTSMLTEFRRLEHKDLLILHVSEQNAGLLIRRQHKSVPPCLLAAPLTQIADVCSPPSAQGEVVVFEAFEASALSEQVLEADNALQWDFPGCAVAIPYSKFNNDSFQDSLASFLEQASTESIKRFAAHTNKAGSFSFESRDTADPSVITQILMTLLEANGRRISLPILRKRVRDDVCWTDGAEKPWRRCAYWLVLRVGLGRHLSILHGGETGRVYYKFILCLVLARLLNHALQRLSPNLLAFLIAKLTRRLAKLEVNKRRASLDVLAVYESMFSSLGPVFHQTTKKANETIEAAWNNLKSSMKRAVLPLPRHADQRHLFLTLPNSGNYLQRVMSLHRNLTKGVNSSASPRPAQFKVSGVTANRFMGFSKRYMSLSEIEANLDEEDSTAMITPPDYERNCLIFAEKIDHYMNAVGDAYDSNPQQKSMMILIVMDLWVSMDRCATKLFHVLQDYSPGILPESLDVLQVPLLADMKRLQKIQDYLICRYKKLKSTQETIFDDPAGGCFAERYFDNSEDSQGLQDLYDDIETSAETAQKMKHDEWQSLSAEFTELEKTIAGSTCIYTTEDHEVVHDDRRCTKCYLQRKSRRMKIEIFEHPLPSDPIQAKAVVFELGCPKAFAAYRNATWRVLGTLARPKQSKSSEPKMMIRDYPGFSALAGATMGGISLASTTKSFLSTHYRSVRLPVNFERVCLPNGLKLGYYDTFTRAWPGRGPQTPTFAHHCQMQIPANSPFSFLQTSPAFQVDSDGLSSYEVIAGQTKCPTGLNIHEYMAYQYLFSGKARRWPFMLIELGSSNLNFSTEATTLLMIQLALQAGPAHRPEPLRTVHRFLRNETFCKRLIDQIDQRLHAIASNWREANCMEMLLTLILRLCALAPASMVIQALRLLENVRTATLRWTSQLRTESRESTNVSASWACSAYAFRAAILCRRTFAIYAEDIHDQHASILAPEDLRCFIESSITLQDNLASDPGLLSPNLRTALVRDLKMAYRLRFVLRRSLESSTSSLQIAIGKVWPQTEGDFARSYSQPRYFGSSKEWWVQLTSYAIGPNKEQIIHYHLLEGHLLIDNQPLGKLPAEYRASVVLDRLFGKQSLLSYPSALPGMTHLLAFKMNGHQIHFGYRDNTCIVQACIRGDVLEMVPREIFGDRSSFDLPGSLITDCAHWLNLRTGIMEIRRDSDVWISKKSQWRLDLNSRIARRNTSSLIDPYSSLFQRIARIFDRFEIPMGLTVYQPKKNPLSVELRRLELMFFVNSKKLLACKQLRSEIDPDQDAKTWYGLNAKIVLRDEKNPRQRSIIVPMGRITYTKNKFHVTINVENNGVYGRFAINEVLGRLECPVEPSLLYMKAHFHACTSFVIPDPLTGRTGIEEAVHCLKSSYCQPWAPLSSSVLEILISIAKLTPKRDYYPKDTKYMQQVFWNPRLPFTIQQDKFRPLIEGILVKSERLSRFALRRPEIPEIPSTGNDHLLHRSYSRRRLYQRPSLDFDEKKRRLDFRYNTRDRCKASQARLNIFESVVMLRKWSSEVRTTQGLAGILQKWPKIGGYDRSFDEILLSDRLEVKFDVDWGALINLCNESGPRDTYRLMFLFAVMSFRDDAEMDVLRTMIAFAIIEDLKSLDPPEWPAYENFRQNHVPSAHYLVQLMNPFCVLRSDDERTTLNTTISHKSRKALKAAECAHEQEVESDCNALAQFLLGQWPCSEPTSEGFPGSLLIDVPKAMDVVRPEWLRLFQNLELTEYLQKVQQVLDEHYVGTKIDLPTYPVEDPDVLPTGCSDGPFTGLSHELFQNTGPVVHGELPSATRARDAWSINITETTTAPAVLEKDNSSDELQMPAREKDTVNPVMEELKRIISGVMDSQSTVRQKYGRDLMQSLEALKIFNSTPKQCKGPVDSANLCKEITNARQIMREYFNQLCVTFERNDPRAKWLKEGRLWPAVTPTTVLEQLRSNSAISFGNGMKECLVTYAESITVLQRLLRVENAQNRHNAQKLLEEHSNSGHINWQPLKHPDWLLLEIDADMMIRPDQVSVALATISPASDSNAVLQMNMGQGKTSCIMPMVALELADKKKLMRIVVPKALLLQTVQLMQTRLGGLVGRNLVHLPFSRQTPTDSETIKEFFNIHRAFKASSGVIVALPEHILSFNLSGLQRLLDARIPEAAEMVRAQSWIRANTRDVLDESDFTLAVRTQLIYPSGSQTTVDGHPNRWGTVETLLKLVEGHLWNLQQNFPHSIEVFWRPQGGFPVVYFLRNDVEDALTSHLVNDIMRGQIPILPTRECKQSDRLAIKYFVSDPIVRPKVAEKIGHMFPDKPAAKKTLYLLRGLLVHRILLLTLKKRWNVQYGLHPNREPIAVPFHGKGVPSEQAEFGHPDVAILLTCLAFYFGGLDVVQLQQSLEHIVNSDDPSSEYDRWTCNSTALPDNLRDWNAINVDDEAQLLEIWHHIRYNIVVVEYFLNQFVFPKYAKQFRTKLQASGWDIPSFPPRSQELRGQKSLQIYSRPLTTGFSGTNDNRTTLPLNIKQEDLRGLSHTNAEVLTYLLQHRNRRYVLAADDRGRHISELDLLRKLFSMRIRMLIDAGAQILEMDNYSLAKEWLKIDHEAPAAVYFSTDNKPFVLYRQGSTTPLLSSPFAESLGDCLVYLDEAHTRGTDLKMPASATGALTLSLGQTKDHTVQAAMRLRQLATTQSVVFLAPPEVHQSIFDLRKKRNGEHIDSYDVICWLLEQTCSGIEQIQPLYFSHGADFCRRTQAALDNPDFLVHARQREAYLSVLQQEEQQTLEQLYKPRLKSKNATITGSSPEISKFMKELKTLRKGFQDTGNAVHASALQEVEQEREVALEVEAVREVQKPMHYLPLSFQGLHKEIDKFVRTGRLAAGYEAYEPALMALSRTPLGLKYGINRNAATVSKLFVSKEFTRTVVLPKRKSNSDMLRQVNWILWSVVTETAIIIIPEEAELLIPRLYDVEEAPVHLLTYAAPVTRKMMHFNDLRYYAMPALPTEFKFPTWLTTELGIFAGRLYFEFEEYSDLCTYLGLQEHDSVAQHTADETTPSTEIHDIEESADEKAGPDTDADITQQTQTFCKQPLTFLQEWLAVRRKGQDFTHTPMGYVCQGKTLTASHPFFTRPEHDAAPRPDGKSNKAREAKIGDADANSDSDTASDPDIDYEDAAFSDDDGEVGEEPFNDSELSSDTNDDETDLD